MNTKELIEYWSSKLSERLVEIRFVDIDQMKASISSHLKSAIIDCLQIQISETEKKLNDAKLRFATKEGSNNKIQSEIILLKEQVKKERMFLAHLDRENQAKEMVLWMRKHHEQSLISFYKYYDTVRTIQTKNPNHVPE